MKAHGVKPRQIWDLEYEEIGPVEQKRIDILLDHLIEHPDGITLDRVGWKNLADAGWTRSEVRRLLNILLAHEIVTSTWDSRPAETITLEPLQVDYYRKHGSFFW